METFEVTASKIFSHETPSVRTVDLQGLANWFYSQNHWDRVMEDLKAQGYAYYCGPNDIELRIKVVR